MESKNSGWIYFIEGGEGLYKVGKAMDMEKRLKSLQTGSPVKLSLRYYFRSDSLTDVERYMHILLKDYRTHGEWYKITDSQMCAIEEIRDFSLDGLNYPQVELRVGLPRTFLKAFVGV